MKRLKIGLMGVGALGAALFIAAPVLAGSTKERPRPIQVQAHGQSVRAAQGSYCVSYTSPHSPHQGTGICADYAYPLGVKGKLAVRAGLRIALRMHDPEIRRVMLRPLSVHGGDITAAGGRFEARRRPGHPNCWIASLPDDLGQANRLDIFVRYRHGIGDADYWAGLRVIRF